MKSLSPRIVLIALLVLTSFFSYAYLNMVSIEDVAAPTTLNEKVLPQGEAENEPEEIYLPDIEILKKAVQASKKALSIAAGLTH